MILNTPVIKTILPILGKQLRPIILAAILIPFTSALSIWQPLMIKKIIDDGILVKQTPVVMQWGLTFIFCVILEYLLRTTTILILGRVGHLTVQQFRKSLFDYILDRSSHFFDKRLTGSLLTRTTTDLETVGESITDGMLGVLIDMVSLIGAVVMMFILQPVLTFFLLATLPPLLLLLNFFRKRLHAAILTARQIDAQINGFAAERIQGIQILQLFNRQTYSFAAFAVLTQRFKRLMMQHVLYDATLYSIVEGFSFILIGVVVLVIAHFLPATTISVGILVAFLDYISKMFLPLKELSGRISNIQQLISAFQRINEILVTSDLIIGGDQQIKGGNLSIKFSHVSYTYPGTQRQVLSDISFDVQPGQVMALVGATGSGKSTLTRLLIKQYNDFQGAINLGHQSIETVGRAHLSQRIGVVFQDSFLFEDSIEANIKLGRDISPANYQQALEICQLKQVLHSSQLSFAHPVNERGRNISKGVRQLISFARALAPNPDIIVLDEATASIDSITEQQIQIALAKILRLKTVIVIAHRLSTIKQADQILVIQQGQIVERGTHQELVDAGNTYANFYQQQFIADPLV